MKRDPFDTLVALKPSRADDELWAQRAATTVVPRIMDTLDTGGAQHGLSDLTTRADGRASGGADDRFPQGRSRLFPALAAAAAVVAILALTVTTLGSPGLNSGEGTDVAALEPTPSEGSAVDQSTDAEFVRYVSPETWAAVITECVRELGFPVELVGNDEVDYSGVPASQNMGAQEATALCNLRYPIDPLHREPLTDAQTAFLYTWYTEESIPCLTGIGLTGFEVPSQETFAQTYDTQPWTPYGDISLEQLGALGYGLVSAGEVCPQGPPQDELFAPELLGDE